MGYISRYIKPYPDELLYSWIHRLADANILPVTTFSDAYLGNTDSRIGTLEYDVSKELPHLCSNLYEKQNVLSLYTSLTTYSFEAIFLEPGRQVKHINRIYRNDALSPAINKLFNSIKICPECIKEDMQTYGEPYIHRAHQLSGVCTCYKHNTGLKQFMGIKGHACEYSPDDYTDVEYESHFQTEYEEYSRYCQKLLEANTGGSSYALKEIIFNCLKDKGYSVDNQYASFINDFNNGIGKLFIGDINKYLKTTLISAKYLDVFNTVLILMFLLPDVNQLISRLNNYENNISFYVCNACGKEYISNPLAQRQGWGCPYCNTIDNPEEAFKEIVPVISADYEYVSGFVSLDKKCIMHHKVCNKDFEIKPRAYLYENTRCTCEYLVSYEEAKRKVEADGQFELLKYNSTETVATIKSNECGHVFQSKYRNFVRHSICPLCKPATMDAELFKQRVYSLVGDEYTIVKGFRSQKEKIALRHNTCGRTQEYQANHFLDGQRCKYCKRINSEAWNTGLKFLRQYKEEYGHVNVPKRDRYKDYSLGLWCQRQRNDYKNGKLTAEQIKILTDTGFSLNPKEDEWNRKYEQYKRYIEQEGTVNITKKQDFEGEHLGAWVTTQKLRYKAGKMSQDRVDKLLIINRDLFI